MNITRHATSQSRTMSLVSATLLGFSAALVIPATSPALAIVEVVPHIAVEPHVTMADEPHSAPVMVPIDTLSNTRPVILPVMPGGHVAAASSDAHDGAGEITGIVMALMIAALFLICIAAAVRGTDQGRFN